MENIDGQVVWITGASSGIGNALALELAHRGAKLILSARRTDRLNALRLTLPDPAHAVVMPIDVAETAMAKTYVEKALESFGRIDVMVHNAGIGQRSRISETDLSVDRRIMEVNYFGVVALTKALLPQMIARGGGRFVVVSSVAGYVATRERSAYAASKHALHGFFEALRAETCDQHIGVTLVCPGYVRTEIGDHALGADGEPQGRGSSATRVGIEPEDCARKIAEAIELQRNETLIGGPEVASVYLRRFAPELLRSLLPKFKSR